jgi:hypothetical protein
VLAASIIRAMINIQIIDFNSLKPKIVCIIFKNSVLTSKKTQHFTITKINLLMLFEEKIAVYTENPHKYTLWAE